jgi:hypothetical protein
LKLRVSAHGPYWHVAVVTASNVATGNSGSPNTHAKRYCPRHERRPIDPMSKQVPDHKLGDAILQTIEHGAFPQDEAVASAIIPSSALPKLLELVTKAKEDTKAWFHV